MINAKTVLTKLKNINESNSKIDFKNKKRLIDKPNEPVTEGFSDYIAGAKEVTKGIKNKVKDLTKEHTDNFKQGYNKSKATSLTKSFYKSIKEPIDKLMPQLGKLELYIEKDLPKVHDALAKFEVAWNVLDKEMKDIK